MSERNETGILDRNLALEVVRVTEAAAYLHLNGWEEEMKKLPIRPQ